MNPRSEKPNCDSRRNFLQKSAVTATSVGAISSGLVKTAHGAGGEGLIRVGMVGCGGRGSGAAVQALKADPRTRLVAMADAFEFRLQSSLSSLKRSDVSDRVVVKPDHQFVGLDSYKQLLATDVDVVLLTTPPGFRPLHLKAAVEAGKHVFAEKPVAVDTAGIKTVLAASEEAREKGLLLVVGLQTRYEPTTQEMVSRIQDGAIGDLRTMRTTRYGGQVWIRPKKTGMTEVEHQVDNWYQFTWLSGDFIVEQFVHEIDRIAWVIDADPVSCIAMGGRQTRSGKATGHVYDHFSAIFKYANDVEFHAATRHQKGCQTTWEMDLAGSEGRCKGTRRNLYTFTGPKAAKLVAPKKSRPGHQLEHDAMYAALRSGDYINNGEYGAKSTLMAIMARDSAYSGQQITWAEKISVDEKLVDVENLTWASELPDWKIAMPGIHGIV